MTIFRLVVTTVAFVLLAGLSGCGETRTEEQRMSDAVTAFESGEYRAALIELKNLLQDNPKNKDARVLLARTSLEVGDAQAAAKELERAGRLGASADEIYTLQQRTWLKVGNYQELVDNYSPENATNPDERGEMRLTYARALNALGQTVQARAEYQSLAASDAPPRWRAEALVGQALLARVAGDDDKAKELANQAISLSPETASAHITLGQIAIGRAEFGAAYEHFRDGSQVDRINDEQRFILISGELEAALGKADIDASKDAANRLFTLAPEHPITSYLMARVAYVSGDKEMAHERAQKVLSEFPEFLPAQFLQGALSLERGEFPQAEMFLSNVVAAQPANYEARKLLAEANLKLGRSTQAAEILREGIRLGPGSKELSNMLGRVNLRFDNSASNILLLEENLKANPDDEQTRLALVASYIAAGRADKAQALVEAGDKDAISPERRAVVKLIAAIQAGDRAAAVSQADNIIATWPDNPRTHSMIGSWLYSQDMKVKARTVLENSYSKNPDFSQLAIGLARIDGAEGKPAEAESRLEEFVQRNPEDVEAWLSLAGVAMIGGERDKALSVLERARAAVPDHFMPQVATVKMYLAERRYDDAVKMGEAVSSQYENEALPQYIYGRALYENGQYDMALGFLNKAISMLPEEREVLTYKARTEARLNRYAQAKKTYEKIWELDPGNFEAAQSIALLELRKGNNAAADEMLAKLRAEQPNDPRVDIVDADLKSERGNHKAAYALYQKAYEARPSRDTALKLARLAEGQGDKSEPYIRRWLEKNPDDVAARLVMAQNFQRKGRTAEAITEYEIIATSRPDDSLVLNNLAWLYFETGDGDSRARALQLARRAYEQSPNVASIADTYGWILVRSGNVEQGKDILALAEVKARDQGLSDARDIAYHYAAALSESGDRAGAKLRLKSILNDGKPFYSREDAQRLLDSLDR